MGGTFKTEETIQKDKEETFEIEEGAFEAEEKTPFEVEKKERHL